MAALQPDQIQAEPAITVATTDADSPSTSTNYVLIVLVVLGCICCIVVTLLLLIYCLCCRRSRSANLAKRSMSCNDANIDRSDNRASLLASLSPISCKSAAMVSVGYGLTNEENGPVLCGGCHGDVASIIERPCGFAAAHPPRAMRLLSDSVDHREHVTVGALRRHLSLAADSRTNQNGSVADRKLLFDRSPFYATRTELAQPVELASASDVMELCVDDDEAMQWNAPDEPSTELPPPTPAPSNPPSSPFSFDLPAFPPPLLPAPTPRSVDLPASARFPLPSPPRSPLSVVSQPLISDVHHAPDVATLSVELTPTVPKPLLPISFTTVPVQPSTTVSSLSPMRPIPIKQKSLFQRRSASNVSLTISLTPPAARAPAAAADGVLSYSVGSICESSGHHGVEEQLRLASHRLTVEQLRTALVNPSRLHEEFWSIPANHPERILVAGSGPKNRYRTVIPNERTRVALKPLQLRASNFASRTPLPGMSDLQRVPETDPVTANGAIQSALLPSNLPVAPVCSQDPTALADTACCAQLYINANYIRGYDNNDRAYIATQGPLGHTISDFWQMIWNEKASAIVMMTGLTERSVAKCERYIPNECGATQRFGDVLVTLCSQQLAPARADGKSSLLVSHLHIELASAPLSQHSQVPNNPPRRASSDLHPLAPAFTHMPTGAAASRTVTHYWFQDWPDHAAPDSTTAHCLIDLILQLDSLSSGALVVHCSAGIGRTGCFIATAIGMKQLQRESAIDVLHIVSRLRLDRGGMVQTNDQYVFVYQMMLYYAEKYLHL